MEGRSKEEIEKLRKELDLEINDHLLFRDYGGLFGDADSLVSKCFFPEFLKNSARYEEVEDTGMLEVSIPIHSEYFIESPEVNSIDDLIKLIKIVDFWGVHQTPDELFDFVYSNKNRINKKKYNKLFDYFGWSNDYVFQIDTIIRSNDKTLVRKCIRENWLDLLKFLHRKGVEFDNNLGSCANNKNLECIKFLVEINCAGVKKNARIGAFAEDLQVEQLEFLLENGFKIDLKSWDSLCLYANFPCIKYIVDKKIIKEEDKKKYSTFLVMQSNSFHILKYLHENGFNIYSQYIINQSIENQNIEAIKYLNDSSQIIKSTDDFNYAIDVGNLEIIKYLHENKWPSNSISIEKSERSDNNELKNYLNEIGISSSMN